MEYTLLAADTFKHIQLNAGIICKEFSPSIGGTPTTIIGSTSGGVSFIATPTYVDYGDDIDNCPKNTMELKKLDTWEAKMSGTFATIDAETAKMLVASGDIKESETKIVPRSDLSEADFEDIWWVGDYSDINTGEKAGHLAIHLMNALSTAGFKLQSADKEKGKFAFEYTAHYSLDDPDTVPFEIYIKQGSES